MKKILTTDIVVERCKQVHKKDDYDYSWVEYIDKNTKIKIFCNKHKMFFEQLPHNHMRGNRCPLCAKEDKTRGITKFIEEAQKLYGDLYTFEKSVYKGDKSKIIVTHKVLGDLEITPKAFLSGSEPLKASFYRRSKKLEEKLINEYKEKWGDKFNVIWDGFLTKRTKVKVICPIHGQSEMLFPTFLEYGCPYCADASFYGIDFTQFKKRAHEKFQDRFIYYNNYTGWNKDITIKCKKHGDFVTTPQLHLLYTHGGCKQCAHEHIALSKIKNDFEEMVELANKIHSNRYQYDRDTYKGHCTKFEIYCPIHGKFEKDYYSHINLAQGCPHCQSSTMEQKMILALIKRNIEFVHQYKPSWIGGKKIDIYLPKYNVAIECQGSQHFYPSSLFGGAEGFKHQVESDKAKKELCEKHKLPLLYYSNLDIEFPYEVWTDIDELLNFVIENFEK